MLKIMGTSSCPACGAAEPVCGECADNEIDALKAENKRLREALEIIEKSYSGSPCNIARAALEGKP